MADYNSSLPVRTENNGDVAAFIADGTTPSQLLAVDASGRITTKLDDGNGNIITSQANGAQRALDVGIDVAGVQIDPRQIRTLTTSDAITATQGGANTISNAWPIKITDGADIAQVLVGGELIVAVTQPLPAGTNIIGAVNQGTSPWITKDQADGSVAAGTAASFSSLAGGQFNTSLPTLTNTQQAALQTDSSARLLVGSIASPLPAGTNLLGAVNLDLAGSPVSATNPVPVTITSSVSGTSVHSAQTSASLAAAATANLQYTVTAAKTLNLARVYSSASGKIKVVVGIETGVGTGVFTTAFVGFNSTANPNISQDFISVAPVAAGVKVQAAITNDDKASFDVYATFEGTEV